MKQKLALACTLIHTPELLILDEPTTGVDPVSRRDFWRILARLQRQGLTLLLTTPVSGRGRALPAGGPHGPLAHPEAQHARRAAGGGRRRRPGDHRRAAKRRAAEILGRLPEISEVESFGERIHATLPGAPADEARRPSVASAEALVERGGRRPPCADGGPDPRRRVHRPHARRRGRRPRGGPPMSPVHASPGPRPRRAGDRAGRRATRPYRLTLAEALERARAHSARLAQLASLETAAHGGPQRGPCRPPAPGRRLGGLHPALERARAEPRGSGPAADAADRLSEHPEHLPRARRADPAPLHRRPRRRRQWTRPTISGRPRAATSRPPSRTSFSRPPRPTGPW